MLSPEFRRCVKQKKCSRACRPNTRKRRGACLLALRATHTSKEALRVLPGSEPLSARETHRTSTSRVKGNAKIRLSMITCPVSIGPVSHRTCRSRAGLCLWSVFLCVIELFAVTRTLVTSTGFMQSHAYSQNVPACCVDTNKVISRSESSVSSIKKAQAVSKPSPVSRGTVDQGARGSLLLTHGCAMCTSSVTCPGKSMVGPLSLTSLMSSHDL